MSLCLVSFSTLPLAVAQYAPSKELELLSHLPKDPVLVWVMSVEDLAATLDKFVEMILRFTPDDATFNVDEAIHAWEANVGFSVREDLLAQIGPEMAVVIDVPPPDQVMAALAAEDSGALLDLLGGIGKVIQVRDTERLDDSLAKFFAWMEAEITEEDGLKRVAFASDKEGEATAPVSGIVVYYGFRENVVAFGFSPEWVRASLAPRPEGERFADGEDFAKVYSHLDAQSTGLFYLNLPKLAEAIKNSPLIPILVANSPESQPMIDAVLSPEFVGVGLGSTSLEMDGGIRRTTFGPTGFSGGAMIGGIVAAIAIPNLLNAIDRGKQKRTMADIRSIGIVCEAYVIDNESYPGPTEGWVPVEEIAEQVEPLYIRTLPRVDGWGNPILFWSDATSTCRIASYGKGGEPDRDWSGEIEPHATMEFTADIVFGNGEFLVWPDGN
jgi:general secretion pathway protein G